VRVFPSFCVFNDFKRFKLICVELFFPSGYSSRREHWRLASTRTPPSAPALRSPFERWGATPGRRLRPASKNVTKCIVSPLCYKPSVKTQPPHVQRQHAVPLCPPPPKKSHINFYLAAEPFRAMEGCYLLGVSTNSSKCNDLTTTRTNTTRRTSLPTTQNSRIFTFLGTRGPFWRWRATICRRFRSARQNVSLTIIPPPPPYTTPSRERHNFCCGTRKRSRKSFMLLCVPLKRWGAATRGRLRPTSQTVTTQLLPKNETNRQKQQSHIHFLSVAWRFRALGYCYS